MMEKQNEAELRKKLKTLKRERQEIKKTRAKHAVGARTGTWNIHRKTNEDSVPFEVHYVNAFWCSGFTFRIFFRVGCAPNSLAVRFEKKLVVSWSSYDVLLRFSYTDLSRVRNSAVFPFLSSLAIFLAFVQAIACEEKKTAELRSAKFMFSRASMRFSLMTAIFFLFADEMIDPGRCSVNFFPKGSSNQIPEAVALHQRCHTSLQSISSIQFTIHLTGKIEKPTLR